MSGSQRCKHAWLAGREVVVSASVRRRVFLERESESQKKQNRTHRLQVGLVQARIMDWARSSLKYTYVSPRSTIFTLAKVYN